MKINRLIEITVLLLNRQGIKAKELAERFEVSTRTIYRDVEDLAMAGVPVYMSKGRGGGISILQDYSINKALLTREDKESLIIALKTLKVTKFPEIDTAIEKISSLFQNENPDDWVQVDFSHWGSNPNENQKFNKIKEAILKRRVISFKYINSFGNGTNRSIEPMKLLYKGQGWYLYGYCLLKKGIRIFRISRIKDLAVSNDEFNRRNLPMKAEGFSYEKDPRSIVTLKLRFSEKALYRIFDDFDDKEITKNEDNTYDVTVTYPEDEWVYGYILSFGREVEVLEPPRIRELILKRLQEVIKKYEDN